MIHATLRAIAYLRGGEDALAHAPVGVVPLVAACGAGQCGEMPVGYVAAAAGDRLPTCPACLVLWDEALENRKTP